jgi:hypothetical protein
MGTATTFFGLNMILGAFPNARAVTAAAVVPRARGQVSPGYLQLWTPTDGDGQSAPTGARARQELVDWVD